MTPAQLAFRESVPTVVITHAPKLKLDNLPIDREALLLAIAGKESAFGTLCGLRVEPAYSPKGKYFNPELKAAFNLYGYAACGSWGVWQLLYATALEMGFAGRPWELFSPDTIPWVIRYINTRCIPKLTADADEEQLVKEIADGYNSGSPKDNIVPVDYMEAVWEYYQMGVLELRNKFKFNSIA